MNPTGAWGRETSEAFLHSEAIPLRFSCRRPADDLWMLSLWFQFRDGALWCTTSSEASVVKHLAYDD